MPPARIALASGLLCLALAASLGTCSFAVTDPAEELARDMLGIELFIGVAAVSGALLVRGSPREHLGLSRGRLPAVSLVLLVVGTLALSHALDAVTRLTGLAERSVLAELEARLAGVRGRALLVLALAIGIAPGVSEELLCRGLIQRGLVKLHGAAVAIPVASLVFGAIHLDPVQGLAAVVLGLYLGTGAYLADSTRASILCHAANNLAALALASGQVSFAAIPGWISVIGGLALAAVALAAVWSRAPLQRAAGTDDG